MMSNKTIDFDIIGMHCAACVSRIEKVVQHIEGVLKVEVNLATETGRVTYNQQHTSLAFIFERISNLGFEAKQTNRDEQVKKNNKRRQVNILKWKVILSVTLTIPLAWAMFAHFQWAESLYVPTLFLHPYFQLAITFPIQFIIGFSFYENAWKAMKNGSANMDVLVVISTSAAFLYSHYLTFSTFPTGNGDPIVLYYETSAFIISFILLGRWLEAKTKSKTMEAMEQLYDLQSSTVTLYENGSTYTFPIEQIKRGHIVIVHAGETVPVDGRVIEGTSLMDEALLTGESSYIEKSYGSFVYAGTMNQRDPLQVEVTKQHHETTLANIIRVVENAQVSKAPIQHIADKVTGSFVPIVILLALFTFTMWYVSLQPGQFNEALENMIAVLIIACPCALGLATPTSVMVGSGRAAQLGILFKEGKYLELLSKCTTVIFDKTGTLTSGTPKVTDMYTSKMSEHELLTLIGAIEQHTDHPIAKALTKYAATKITRYPVATDVDFIRGHGIKATVDGKEIIIANPTYFKKIKHPLPLSFQKIVSKLMNEAKTVVVIQVDASFSSVIAVSDDIKSSALSTMIRLQQLDLDLIMLTGDNEQAGAAVANKLGITTFQTEVSPLDKTHIIEQLQKEKRRVMMVGDGINDAPALTTANVGIALSTGSDIAMEAGDVTIIHGDIDRVVDAFLLSKKTLTNIKQNLLWAFLYNILMIPFAMFGFLAPWIAGAAMALSSISVLLNALRLKTVGQN